MSSLMSQQELDQVVTAIENMAHIVSSFYCTLVSDGVSPEHALDLTVPVSEAVAFKIFNPQPDGDESRE